MIMDQNHTLSTSSYRKVFASAANHLTQNEAHTLCYVYDVEATWTDSVPMVLCVFKSLEKKGLLTPDDKGMAFLWDMLCDIGRVDIANNSQRLGQQLSFS